MMIAHISGVQISCTTLNDDGADGDGDDEN